MKMQVKSDGKRMNHDRRGQKGSLEIHHVTPVVNLNWQKMNERQDIDKPYYPIAKGEQAVVVRDAYPNLGRIFGDRIVVRGSSEYYY